MAERVDVAIVGAGLCGLALAVGLHSRGFNVHLYEKTDGKKADTATGISIGLNGGRALEGLRPGLLEEMQGFGSETKLVKIIDHTDPSNPVELELQSSPVLFMIPWRTARKVLAELVPSSSVHCLHKLISYQLIEHEEEDDTEEMVKLTFQVNNEVGGQPFEKEVLARLVIGADGVHSAVRKMMIGDKPRDLGLINWNALVYNPDSKFFKVHEKDQIVMIRNGATFVHLADSGEGYTLWVFRKHDQEIQTGAFGGPEVKQRVVEAIEKLEPAEIWKPFRVAVEATDPSLIFERRIIDNPPLKTWSDLDSRVLLVGDAAHAMHWGPGQGARTAFEDAHQLTELLAAALPTRNSSEIKSAVKRFEEMRVPRMTRMQEYAAEGTDLDEFIPEWVRKLPVAERRKRMREFQAWVDSYPDKLHGDPDSTYFKPKE